MARRWYRAPDGKPLTRAQVRLLHQLEREPDYVPHGPVGKRTKTSLAKRRLVEVVALEGEDRICVLHTLDQMRYSP